MRKAILLLTVALGLTIATHAETLGEWRYDDWNKGFIYTLLDSGDLHLSYVYTKECMDTLMKRYIDDHVVPTLVVTDWDSTYIESYKKKDVSYIHHTSKYEDRFGVLGPASFLCPMNKNILPGEGLGQYNERMGIKPEKKYKVIGPPEPPDSPYAGAVPIEEVE
jgi:hypothetical protein